ncbi:MAG: cation-translocating P-type ATPase [Myxococcales bacterium]|nr:cation-translocating P-type ATPase [Myxococcales bacterium]MCB9581603.1 cation-translocating P-type ATPase [Polyangiaceae bacterium]
MDADAFDLSSARGLTEAEAQRRLVTDGPNELPTDERPSFFAQLFAVLREPMLLLLLGGGALYLLLGDLKDALTLLSFVVVIIAITFYQERKTERALAALRDLSSPRASVVRDGAKKRIPGREVVVGDLVLLAEGDRVPADAAVLECMNLSADESLLTGEAVPARKRATLGVPETARPGGDDLPFVYSGTLVVSGTAAVRVLETGVNTELGKIGASLSTLKAEKTPLEVEVSSVVKKFAIGGLTLCVLLIVVFGLSRGDWLRGLLAGIALAMAVLPEEFPVVLTVFLALGAWRISRRGVLTRRVPTVELLGAATVLCSDKTGTLTQNRMAIAELWTPAGAHAVGDEALPESVHSVVEFGILASQRDPFDPMEVAFKELGQSKLLGTEHLHDSWSLLREYPLSPELLSVSHVWREPEGAARVIAAKGAPEAIIDLCHLDAPAAKSVEQRVRAMAQEGLRVLAVARAYFDGDKLPPEQHDYDFELVGLVGLADPLRPTVENAVAECKSAGIRVVMITGDYAETARTIGKEAGLASDADLITGVELDALSDDELRARVRHLGICARVVPEQKLRLVQALKAEGEVVAMTGDGVNDAPALKAAHIGVAMGGRGTDVAREAAALVLTDDDFSSIVAAVRIGRRIFANLKKAMVYIIAIHVPIAGMSLIPVLLGWPLALYPLHIVFLELVIDPSCSIAFEAEPEEKDIMRRPPRPIAQRLLDARMVGLGVVQGTSLLAASLAVFGLSLANGASEAQARTLTFATLMVGNLGLIATNRSWTRSVIGNLRVPNLPARLIFLGAVVVLGATLFVPPVRDIFHFAPVPAGQLVVAIVGGAVLCLAWLELVKLVSRRRLHG